MVRSVGGQGRSRGHFTSPQSFVRDNQGNLIICDTGNHRVQVVSASGGAHIRTIGQVGLDNTEVELSSPDCLALSVDGRALAVADTNNNRSAANQGGDIYLQYCFNNRLGIRN